MPKNLDYLAVIDIQDCKLILLSVLAQAVKDYQQLKFKNRDINEEADYITASNFIFNNKYSIDWGDKILSTEDVCSLLDLDLNWLRNQIIKHLDLKLDLHGKLTPKKRF